MPKLSNTLIVVTLFVGVYTSSTFSLEIKARHTPEKSKTTQDHDFDVSLKINLDANRFNGIYNDILQDGFSYDSQVRRTRLTVKMPVIENWSSKLQIAINEDDDNYEIKDLYVRYRGFETADVKIGKFKEPFGLENLTSSANNLFTERSLSTFAIGRNKGISLSKANNKYSWNIGTYDIQQNGKVKADGDRAYTARATFSPKNKIANYNHIGLAYSKRDLQGAKYEIKTNGGVDNAINFIDTINIATDSIEKSGLELAWGRGPLSLQSEFQRLQINATNVLENATYKGYYGQLSYFITNDYRPYKKGRFSKVSPSSSKGAWEIAIRKGSLQSVNIGIENENNDIQVDSTVLGINYYQGTNLKFMLNSTDTKTIGVESGNSGSAFSVRVQIRI
jgi:phosphate-selective porin OprO/OprP